MGNKAMCKELHIKEQVAPCLIQKAQPMSLLGNANIVCRFVAMSRFTDHNSVSRLLLSLLCANVNDTFLFYSVSDSVIIFEHMF